MYEDWSVILGDDTIAVLAAAGLMFPWALGLGVVKYRQMATSPEALAHQNQFRDPVPGTHGFMVALILAELGGFAVLLAGFADAQIF